MEILDNPVFDATQFAHRDFYETTSLYLEAASSEDLGVDQFFMLNGVPQ